MARRPKKIDSATAGEVAAALGVTSLAVERAAPSRVVRMPDGGYDLEATLVAWEANRSMQAGPGRGNKREVPAVGVDWRDKKDRESYLKLRLERQALQGKLVPLDVAEAERADTSALIRTRLEGIAPKIADKLAVCSSPRECRDMVAEEIRVVLEELADAGEEVE